MANNIIREGVKFGSTLKECPQTMTVTSVSDTEVQFTRKGFSGIFMMWRAQQRASPALLFIHRTHGQLHIR